MSWTFEHSGEPASFPERLSDEQLTTIEAQNSGASDVANEAFWYARELLEAGLVGFFDDTGRYDEDDDPTLEPEEEDPSPPVVEASAYRYRMALSGHYNETDEITAGVTPDFLQIHVSRLR